MNACVGTRFSELLFIPQVLPGTGLGDSGELLFYPQNVKGKLSICTFFSRVPSVKGSDSRSPDT